jgi:anaerobic selenocysteine-containing dehydrogenase
MERRDFLKVTALTGATAALSGCEKPVQQLVRFVPEEDLVPGVAVWKPSLCTLCSAGCGLTVRVMEGEAEVVRKGQIGLIKMGLAKKLEGNPDHPVNHGKLCARGQAGLQLTYHPDRVRGPLKCSGPRGSGNFQEITWEEALSEVVSKLQELRSQKHPGALRFLVGRLRGQRRQLIKIFLKTLDAPPEIVFDPLDEPVLRQANLLSFGRAAMPSFDLARANYVVSFGADFLGTWNSPVAQSIGYGEMRQGRPGSRGKLVQVEQRMSQTGANADEWVPVRPGMEGALALGFVHVILKENLLPSRENGAMQILAGWQQGLPDYSPEVVESKTGVAAKQIERLAREMAAHRPAVAMIGGAPVAHTNGLFSALAVNALNTLLGSVGAPGGMFFTPRPPLAEHERDAEVPDSADQCLAGKFNDTQVLLLYDANPVFAAPAAWKVRETLEKIPFIVSFGSFVDETSMLADLILPDHSPLESWLDDLPESGAARAMVSLAGPVMLPLHETRAMPDVLLEIAHQLGGDVAKTLPWQSFEEMLKASMLPLRTVAETGQPADPEKFWAKVQEQGGWWSDKTKSDTPTQSASIASGGRAFKQSASKRAAPDFTAPQFDGNANEFPFHFHPYVSQAFLDGSLAHLPWMQEMPDALSTVMWGTWIEINPRTAAKLGIGQGDLVEVRSQHGTLQASALVSPGIAPDVIAMPFGQGHENFGRYASNRGANPMTILAPMQVAETGSLAWAATRVNLTKVGKGKLALFAGGLRERPSELEHR